MFDDFGDRMKDYEARETSRRFMNFIPVVARMDGRGFSKFTKGLNRPFDEDFSNVMIATAKRLVEATNARISFVQSDEISLVWLIEDIESQMMFDGKVQKLCSVLSGMTTAFFINGLLAAPERLSSRVDRSPHFDARVFQVPTRSEATNALLWRERDAAKNSVSMAARRYYSHKSLQGKKSSEMKQMLFDKGVNYDDYPASFRLGSFLQSKVVTGKLSPEILDKIPEKHRAKAGGIVTRTIVSQIDMPPFTSVVNRDAVVFDGEEPRTV